MPALKLQTLSAKIDALTPHPAHYDLRYLCVLLEKDPRITASSPIVKLTAELVDALNELNTDSSNLELVDKIIEKYNALRVEAKMDGVGKKIYEFILEGLGVTLAMVLASVLAIPFCLYVGVEKSIEFARFTPQAFLFGFVLGVVAGLMIGWRLPKKLHGEATARSQQNIIQRLAATLDYERSTLLDHPDTAYAKCYETEETELKKLFLDENGELKQDEFNAFLTGEQAYQLSSLSASFFTTCAKGYLGHHSMITFKIQDKPHVIELGAPTPAEHVSYPQNEKREARFERKHRQATGAQLLAMLAMHRHLQPRFELSRDNARRFFKEYKLGEQDCHHYVSMVLAAAGEKPNTLEKSPQRGRKRLGHDMAKLADFLNPSHHQALLTFLDRGEASSISIPSMSMSPSSSMG